MDAPTTISVCFPGKQAETLHALSLAGAAALLLARQYERGEGPLLLELAAPGKKLFFQEGTLRWYLTGQLTYNDTVAALWCHGLYRNTTNLVTQLDVQIEAGSLWMLRDGQLLLIDEDETVSCEYNVSAQLFEEVA